MILKLSIALALFAACGSTSPAQSLWNPDRPFPSLFSDTTARNVGDVLTISISEHQSVKNQETTEFKKGSTLDASLENFQILPNLLEPLPAAKGSSQRNFKGDAKYDKDGSFQTQMSVMVIDVQPNGNLVIEGRHRIVMDREEKMIRITGIVRPFDIASNNTVQSQFIANASIAYEGSGALTQTTNRGWLSEMLDFIWPF